MSDVVTKLERALALVRLLPEHVQRAAEISISPDDDCVDFDWHYGRRATVSASILPDGNVAWARLLNDGRDHATMPLEQAASALTSNCNLLAASVVPNDAATESP